MRLALSDSGASPGFSEHCHFPYLHFFVSVPPTEDAKSEELWECFVFEVSVCDAQLDQLSVSPNTHQ